jgi:2-methylcitrate dehydratase PrpD
MTALEQLGQFVAQCGRDGIHDDVRELVELHVIDTVGAWIAGAQTAEGCDLLELREVMRIERKRLGPLSLDLGTRCALARLSEIDDIHLPSMTTPGGIIVASALTLAAANPMVKVDDFINAILAGYEMITRLGRALDGPSILYRGIWPTYLATPFGVAAVDARLSGLNETGTANALALALISAAPGVGHHNAVTTSRWLAIANAARNGLVAVAAERGFTSDLKLIEGKFFPDIYGVSPDLRAFMEGIYGDSVLREVSFKPWCAARQTMPATQALREIIASGVSPDAISEVQAFVVPAHLKMINHGIIEDDRASYLTSLPYCMAVAAAAPQLALDVQQSETELPPALHAFMQKITVLPDNDLLTDYPRRWPARVHVVAGSTVHERLVTDVPGDPARAFNRVDVRTKFFRFVEPIVGPGKAERILARCSDIFVDRKFDLLLQEIEETCRIGGPSEGWGCQT